VKPSRSDDAGVFTADDAGVMTGDDGGVMTDDDAGAGTDDDAGVRTDDDAGVVGPTPTEPPTEGGCACLTSSAASSMPTWLFALFVGLLVRRQRARTTK